MIPQLRSIDWRPQVRKRSDNFHGSQIYIRRISWQSSRERELATGWNFMMRLIEKVSIPKSGYLFIFLSGVPGLTKST
jgi:hypothetical protein